jgi:hypothetical protein
MVDLGVRKPLGLKGADGRSGGLLRQLHQRRLAWAEWIAWQLEAEGYQVTVQAWDFVLGRDWVREMQHATSTAERVVAVLSAAYLRSAHGEAEWRVFYAQDPTGEQGPSREAQCDPTKVHTKEIRHDGPQQVCPVRPA